MLFCVQQFDPAVAVGLPSAQELDSGQGGLAHGALEFWFVYETLHTFCQRGGVANRHNKTFHAICVEGLPRQC